MPATVVFALAIRLGTGGVGRPEVLLAGGGVVGWLVADEPVVATAVTAAGEPVDAVRVDVAGSPIGQLVSREAEIAVDPALTIDAVRPAGRIGRSGERTRAVNGEKVMPIAPVTGAARVRLRRRHRMGAGLGSPALECEPLALSARRAG